MRNSKVGQDFDIKIKPYIQKKLKETLTSVDLAVSELNDGHFGSETGIHTKEH